MKKLHFALAVILVLAVTGIVVTSLLSLKQERAEDRFSITGSGTVYAKADIANIGVGLKTGTKKTAAEASTEATEKMNKIVEAVKTLGVEEKDIKTSGYTLNPIYNWTEGRGQFLTGYEVTQNINLKIRDLKKIGDVIARTTEQGANQIGDIAFTIDDEFDLKNQAREQAIVKAKEKAVSIAEQTGMKLGEIKGFYESASLPVPSPLDYSNIRLEAKAMNDAALPSPEIQPGQNEIKVEVTLVYEVK
ncbi:MAG: SIMPL domain-containing protein [Candidatus Falkowbacteria bacterium]